MKKILFAAFMVFAAFFIVSCAGEDEIANALGKPCTVEGEETCSADSSQILICQDFLWQAKKNCNLNFGQYCRQTASGAYSCTDSGSTNDSTDTEPEDNEPTEQATDDNEPTEPEPEDNDPTEQEPEDNDPTEPEPEDNDPTEPDDTDHENTDIETCADIIKCQAACSSGDCSAQCYNDGSTQAQNDFYAWKNCKTEHNYDYNEIIKDEACKNAMIGCGEVGDMTYGLPYGHAVIQTSIPYLYSEADVDSDGSISIAYSNSATTFIIGNFGNSGNIVNPAAQGTFAFAFLDKFTDTQEDYIAINQDYQGTIVYNPVARMVISATEPGTYTVGVGTNDKVRLFINELNSDKKVTCTHAFGFGSITISAIGYTPGATTISISESEVDLYSFKNAPMYVGHDISDNTDWIACDPQ